MEQVIVAFGKEILLDAALSYRVLSPYWSVYWSTQKRKFVENFWNQKQRKVPDFLRNQELFGGDYWTRTSDLLRVKQAL